ncbi:MAG: group I truncated hemoglobin [Acidimicrobiia bacterium]
MAGETTEATGQPSHYERIGGAATVREAVDRFYRLVLDDADLAPYFSNSDIAEVKRHQVLLLSQVLGGPANYAGRDLGEAHRGLGITGDHYGKVVDHLVGVLEDMGADREAVEAVATTVASLEPDIVEGGGSQVPPGA